MASTKDIIELVLRIDDKASEPLDDIKDKTDDVADSEKKLEKQNKGLNVSFKDLEGGLKVAAAGLLALAAATAAAATAAFSFAQQYADMVNGIIDTADRAGASVPLINGLKLALEGAGLEMSELDGIFGGFKGVLRSAATGVGEQADIFRKLGVEIKDVNGNFRDMDSLFIETINGLSQVEGQTDRNVMAVALFGESAGKLNNALGSNLDTLDEYIIAANGVAQITDVNAKQAADWQRGISAIKLAFSSFMMQISVALDGVLGENGILKAFEYASKGIVLLGFNIRQNIELLTILGQTFVDLGTVWIQKALENIQLFSMAMSELASGNFRKSALIIERGFENTASIMGELKTIGVSTFSDLAKGARMWSEDLDNVLAGVDSLFSLFAGEFSLGGPSPVEAIEAVNDELEKTSQRMKDLIKKGSALGISVAHTVAAGPNQINPIEFGISTAGSLSQGPTQFLMQIARGIDHISGTGIPIASMSVQAAAAIAAVGQKGADAILGGIDTFFDDFAKGVDEIGKIANQIVPMLIEKLLPTLLKAFIKFSIMYSAQIIFAIPQIIASLLRVIIDELPMAIVEAFKEIVEEIRRIFEDLGDSIRELVRDTVSIGGRIGGGSRNIGDRVSGFFDDIRQRRRFASGVTSVARDGLAWLDAGEEVVATNGVRKGRSGASGSMGNSGPSQINVNVNGFVNNDVMRDLIDQLNYRLGNNGLREALNG